MAKVKNFEYEEKFQKKIQINWTKKEFIINKSMFGNEIYHFSDLKEYRIEGKRKVYGSGDVSMTKALIGSAFLGNMGLLLGVGGKNNKMLNLNIFLTIKNQEKKINFLNSAVKENGFIFKTAMKSAEDVALLIEKIINNKK